MHFGQDSQEVVNTTKKSVDRFMLKSKTVTPQYTEVTAEVRLKGDDTQFLNDLESSQKVQKATMITYSGDLAAV